MRKRLVAVVLLASVAVASGQFGTALVQPVAAMDGHGSSASGASVEGLATAGPDRTSSLAQVWWDDDDEDDEDEEGEEDEEDEEDEEEADDDDGDDSGPPDDDDQEDDGQEDDGQEDDGQEDDGQEDGTDGTDGNDTSSPTASTSSAPPAPSSVTIDSLEVPPARFDVSAATRNNGTITTGESLWIDVRIENTGLQDGTYEVALRVDGQTVDTETVAMGAGGAETKTFEWRFDEPGEYDLAVGNTSLGTVNVTGRIIDVRRAPETTAPPDSIVVVTAIAPADWVRDGYRTTVRMVLVNTANRTATRTFSVTVADKPVAVETVTLGPNESGIYSIDFAASAGSVAVDGIEAGRIDVGPATETERQSTDAAGGAGMGIYLGILLLVSFVGVAGHVIRRRG